MKTLFTIICMVLFSIDSFSQESADIFDVSEISYVTPKKDTLYLLDSDIGKMIENIWINENSFDKPVIIFKNDFEINYMNKRKTTARPGTRYIVQAEN